MFSEPANCVEIHNVVSLFPLKKSRDHHDMNMYCIKYTICSLTKPLLLICNLSFNAGIFTDEMKIARVVHIYKK